MSKLDPWEARVALVLGDELPKEEPLVSNVSKPFTNSDFLRKLKSIPQARVDIFSPASFRDSKDRYAPFFNQRETASSVAFVTEPAYRGKLVTKADGLPRMVRYNGRVYVRSSESLLWSIEEEEESGSVPYRELFDATPEDAYGLIKNFPVQISISREKYTLYREGQYDIVGFWMQDLPGFLGSVGRQMFVLTSYCSLCTSRVSFEFTVQDVKLLTSLSTGVDLLRGFMSELKEKECTACKNTGKVP